MLNYYFCRKIINSQIKYSNILNMSIIKPFAAWRPAKKWAVKIAARPYDVMNRQEAKDEAKNNPLSFLHISRAEIDLPDTVNDYDPQVYLKARSNFDQFVQQGLFTQDKQPSLYVYSQTMNGKKQTGLVTLVSVDEYLNNGIKKHEFTRYQKEKDRIDHIQATKLHSEPVFLTYKQDNDIDEIILRITDYTRPVYEFTSPDGVEHVLWTTYRLTDVVYLKEYFENQVKELYIADGHHRAEAAAKVCLSLRSQNSGYTGQEGFNFFLAVLFPDNQVNIMDYNRVVKDLNGHTPEQFLEKLSQYFNITPDPENPKPPKDNMFGMYLNSKWYRLVAKKEYVNTKHPIESLSVSLLSKYVLDNLLGIKDQRSDSRIDFVGGIRGISELENRVNSKEMQVAFAIPPVTVKQLFQVADAGEVMPPKSTWFEPKLRSGLFIHEF